MTHGIFTLPEPRNEPVLDYRPGSPERATLQETLRTMAAEEIEIPVVIGGERIRTPDLARSVMPHDHGHTLARVHLAGAKEIERAIQVALRARKEWAALPWWERAAVFRRAATLLAGRKRATMNAATMLGQSKNVFQAEIDAACEMVDFFNFNTSFAERLYREQPQSSSGTWNTLEHRPLEGFVFAASPFNFTSIAGNLPTAPAICGNVVLWKPASSALFSAYHILLLLEEAGLPPGVINFVPCSGQVIGPIVLTDPSLGGIHFTGSTETFRHMWKTVGDNIHRYRSYPRLVGETGGKDFVIAHASAEVEELCTALIRGAFEYQGQKCSAASRAYVPQCLWPRLRSLLLDQLATVKMGGPEDFSCFVNAVIDRPSFERIRGYIEYARGTGGHEIIAGGRADARTGYFIEPTVVVAEDPRSRLMEEEIFGPVLTIHVYADSAWGETLEMVDTTSPYALTGAVFARDRKAIVEARMALANAAGNFYINDKPTGAVVGQQPFGGARASGTNDKAGSVLNLQRWVSPRVVKETFAPARDYRYPFLEPDRG